MLQFGNAISTSLGNGRAPKHSSDCRRPLARTMWTDAPTLPGCYCPIPRACSVVAANCLPGAFTRGICPKPCLPHQNQIHKEKNPQNPRYSMDSTDIVDTVNELLKLGVGDQYRLEHIKLSYMESKTLWDSDKRYLERMKEKYLTVHKTEEIADPALATPVVEDDREVIHCWKCGKKNLLSANYCMKCGIALFDVGTKGAPRPHGEAPASRSRFPRWAKILVIVVAALFVLAAVSLAFSYGYFDGTDDAPRAPAPRQDGAASKCGAGTVFDAPTNSCVLER
ncbi:hypothetical protein CENSYa_0376 [Cenarchaeum symbiosum A]|uniref:Zinc-ribbon domain-containing protein n=1 Tax=Cenarchaeum symbiosum (strain A) TaxID=414004 RepID=A0RUJ5_CENSY|nr:hypothetical protein CENSYa_0376 [Cenarchaeum symbiosum A]